MEQSRGSNPTRRLRGPLDTRLCVGLTWRAEKSGHSRSPPSPPRFLCPAIGARLDYYFSEDLLAYFILIFFLSYIYIYARGQTHNILLNSLVPINHFTA